MPDSPQTQWPLARILEAYKGNDGNVCLARIQVSDKSMLDQ